MHTFVVDIHSQKYVHCLKMFYHTSVNISLVAPNEKFIPHFSPTIMHFLSRIIIYSAKILEIYIPVSLKVH